MSPTKRGRMGSKDLNAATKALNMARPAQHTGFKLSRPRSGHTRQPPTQPTFMEEDIIPEKAPSSAEYIRYGRLTESFPSGGSSAQKVSSAEPATKPGFAPSEPVSRRTPDIKTRRQSSDYYMDPPSRPATPSLRTSRFQKAPVSQESSDCEGDSYESVEAQRRTRSNTRDSYTPDTSLSMFSIKSGSTCGVSDKRYHPVDFDGTPSAFNRAEVRRKRRRVLSDDDDDCDDETEETGIKMRPNNASMERGETSLDFRESDRDSDSQDGIAINSDDDEGDEEEEDNLRPDDPDCEEDPVYWDTLKRETVNVGQVFQKGEVIMLQTGDNTFQDVDGANFGVATVPEADWQDLLDSPQHWEAITRFIDLFKHANNKIRSDITEYLTAKSDLAVYREAHEIRVQDFRDNEVRISGMPAAHFSKFSGDPAGPFIEQLNHPTFEYTGVLPGFTLDPHVKTARVLINGKTDLSLFSWDTFPRRCHIRFVVRQSGNVSRGPTEPMTWEPEHIAESMAYWVWKWQNCPAKIVFLAGGENEKRFIKYFKENPEQGHLKRYEFPLAQGTSASKGKTIKFKHIIKVWLYYHESCLMQIIFPVYHPEAIGGCSAEENKLQYDEIRKLGSLLCGREPPADTMFREGNTKGPWPASIMAQFKGDTTHQKPGNVPVPQPAAFASKASSSGRAWKGNASKTAAAPVRASMANFSASTAPSKLKQLTIEDMTFIEAQGTVATRAVGPGEDFFDLLSLAGKQAHAKLATEMSAAAHAPIPRTATVVRARRNRWRWAIRAELELEIARGIHTPLVLLDDKIHRMLDEMPGSKEIIRECMSTTQRSPIEVIAELADITLSDTASLPSELTPAQKRGVTVANLFKNEDLTSRLPSTVMRLMTRKANGHEPSELPIKGTCGGCKKPFARNVPVRYVACNGFVIIRRLYCLVTDGCDTPNSTAHFKLDVNATNYQAKGIWDENRFLVDVLGEVKSRTRSKAVKITALLDDILKSFTRKHTPTNDGSRVKRKSDRLRTSDLDSFLRDAENDEPDKIVLECTDCDKGKSRVTIYVQYISETWPLAVPAPGTSYSYVNGPPFTGNVPIGAMIYRKDNTCQICMRKHSHWKCITAWDGVLLLRDPIIALLKKPKFEPLVRLMDYEESTLKEVLRNTKPGLAFKQGNVISGDKIVPAGVVTALHWYAKRKGYDPEKPDDIDSEHVSFFAR